MENKVKAALISIARIDDAREHKEYGYWHRHDHMPEVLSRPGVLVAQRLVAPPAYLRARPPDEGDVAGAQYLTYYMLGEPLESILEMFSGGSRAFDLRGAGRLRLLKNSSTGGIFRLVKSYVHPRVVVSPGAVAFLPHTGVFASVSDLVVPAHKERIDRWYDEVHIPDMLSVHHVTACYWFEAWTTEHKTVNVAAAPKGRTVRLFFLDGDPLEMTLDLRWRVDQWRSAGRMKVYEETKAVHRLLSGPFMPVTSDRFDWFD
ncbi:MAG: hypothetical protein HY261_07325 [Chloroflexi bacterium]|nr:hypothetical protein [Chloroflexota bacterium]